MLQILIITLREGIEAFLIIAITAGILRQTGRAALLPALYWGTGVAVVASFIASVFFAQAENKPLWEGFLAAAAAIMVATMTVYMWKTARTMRASIGKKIELATHNKPGHAAWWGVFFFVLLMIVREGMETALLLSTLFLQQGERDMLIGGLLGVAGAAAIAWGWVRYGRRVNLPRFFQVTAIFLLLAHRDRALRPRRGIRPLADLLDGADPRRMARRRGAQGSSPYVRHGALTARPQEWRRRCRGLRRLREPRFVSSHPLFRRGAHRLARDPARADHEDRYRELSAVAAWRRRLSVSLAVSPARKSCWDSLMPRGAAPPRDTR